MINFLNKGCMKVLVVATMSTRMGWEVSNLHKIGGMLRFV